MSGFEEVVRKLSDGGIAGDLWVNGSFLTQKIDPIDIDASLRLQFDVWNNRSPEQQVILDWFESPDRLSEQFSHLYMWIEYPQGHPDYWHGEYMHAYWMKQWGFSRGEEVKGMAVIILPSGAS